MRPRIRARIRDGRGQRAAERVQRQEHNQAGTAHDRTGKLQGWAADPTSIRGPARGMAESDYLTGTCGRHPLRTPTDRTARLVTDDRTETLLVWSGTRAAMS